MLEGCQLEEIRTGTGTGLAAAARDSVESFANARTKKSITCAPVM